METQGKGAFDLDGASEPYNRGARHASMLQIRIAPLLRSGLQMSGDLVGASPFVRRLRSTTSNLPCRCAPGRSFGTQTNPDEEIIQRRSCLLARQFRQLARVVSGLQLDPQPLVLRLVEYNVRIRE